MFRLEAGQKLDGKELVGGRHMRESDGKLCSSNKERGTVWKDYVDRIMIRKEIAAECPLAYVSR